MLAQLPVPGGPTLFIDVSALRNAGLVDLIAGTGAVEDPEYARFVAATGFDYRRDLDAAAVLFRSGNMLLILRGRFDLHRLSDFARSNGGRCAGDLCSLQGSSPERQISWMPTGHRLLGLAVSPDPLAAALLAGPAQPLRANIPASPLWLELPGDALRPTGGLPESGALLLNSIAGAQNARFTAVPAASAFEVHLEASFESAAQASSSLERLQQNTATIKQLLEKASGSRDSYVLASILAAGAFRTDGKTVRAAWPVSSRLLESLAR